jgi:hypothetical protein
MRDRACLRTLSTEGRDVRLCREFKKPKGPHGSALVSVVLRTPVTRTSALKHALSRGRALPKHPGTIARERERERERERKRESVCVFSSQREIDRERERK